MLLVNKQPTVDILASKRNGTLYLAESTMKIQQNDQDLPIGGQRSWHQEKK